MAAQLPSLPEVERLSPLVVRVLGGNPGKFTLQGTNTYLIGRGSQRLLIDTGEGRPTWIKTLGDVLKEEKATISKAIITHWHPDHVGGIKDLLELSPATEIHKHLPNSEQLDINDAEKFFADGATLRAFFCPGHTKDHMALILEEEDAMFTGDNVLGHGTAVFEDLKLYLASLAKMQDQFKGRAYPAHGAVIDDGRGKIGEYIKHRQQREEEIVRVMERAESPVNSMEIVKVVYKEYPESLHQPAERGVLQVLRKLLAEEKVTFNEETTEWSLSNRASL